MLWQIDFQGTYAVKPFYFAQDHSGCYSKAGNRKIILVSIQNFGQKNITPIPWH